MSTTDEPDLEVQRAQLRETFEPETRTRHYKGVATGWSDARSIREDFSLRPFHRSIYTRSGELRDGSPLVRFPDVIPDCFVHLRRDERERLKRSDPDLSDYDRDRREVLEWLAADPDALQAQHMGGTDFLATGEPGSGKSTLALNTARLLMEVNEEAVVWRGTPSRTEWLPFAPWATVLIPAGYDLEVIVQPYNTDQSITLALEDVVREVVRYDDPVDVLGQLEPGKFHVVYPDPSFKGCGRIMRESSRTPNFEFVPEPEATGEDPPTPLDHWWFAIVTALVDVGAPHWVSVIIDEVGDLLPQSARNDDHDTYRKVEAYRDALVDARKSDVSLFHFGHNEADVHDLIRRKLRWRITMNGWPNPTKGDKVVGFETAPMETQRTTYMSVGEALFWTHRHFSEFTWSDIPKPISADVRLRFKNFAGGSAA